MQKFRLVALILFVWGLVITPILSLAGAHDAALQTGVYCVMDYCAYQLLTTWVKERDDRGRVAVRRPPV